MKKCILLIGFECKNYRAVFDNIESKITEIYENYDIQHIFFRQIMIDKTTKKEKKLYYEIEKTMDRLAAEGVSEVVIQPDFIMNGYEYEKIRDDLKPYTNLFLTLKIGRPLLSTMEDYDAVIKILSEEAEANAKAQIAEYTKKNTAIIFWSYGTDHYVNATYSQMDSQFKSKGYENIFVITTEGYPSLNDMIVNIAESEYDNIVLLPLMIRKEEDAKNQMMGKTEEDLKTKLQEKGFQVYSIQKGIEEYQGIQNLFITHIQEAIEAEPKKTEKITIKHRKTDAAKQAILVVSFGTSYQESREKTIGAVEKKIKEEFLNYSIFRAFTSQMIINKLKKRDKEKIFNIPQAMQHLLDERYGSVIIQPTYVMNGYEYEEMLQKIAPFQKCFNHIAIGTPLLTKEKDYDTVTEILAEEAITEAKKIIKEYFESTAIIFMGHGTEHYANAAYSKLNSKFKTFGYDNIFVTTVEGYPSFKDTISWIDKDKYKNVILFPLMIVAGDHANHDMAGQQEGSLKMLLEKEGFQVYSVLKGIGEYKKIQELFARHVDQARKSKK